VRRQTNADDVARLMDGATATLMVTDPPYGVNVAGGTHDPRDELNYRSGGRIANDALTGPRLGQFLTAAFERANAILAPGSAWYVFYAGTETRAVLDAVAAIGGMRHVLVWVKPNFVFGRSDYHYRHEPVMYGWTDGAAHAWLGDRSQDSVWEFGRSEDLAKKQHPTAKPVGVYEKAIGNHVDVGAVVYEPFSGSGSALIAAERLSRRCHAMEIDPQYVAVAIKRWEQFTGREAVQLG
jgi:DNA modification methylase